MLETLIHLLLTASLTGPAGLYPPENAHLLGTVPVVPLHWNLPGKDFYLTVTAAGRTVFQGGVTGNSYDLPVRSGSLVRWSVVPVGSQGQPAEFHSFQYSSQAVFRFQGRSATASRKLQNGIDGTPGPNGGDGPPVTVQLQQTQEGVALTIDSQKFLLLPSTGPIRVESVGGDGGSGTQGQPGAAGLTQYGTGGYTLSLSNLDGGPGGVGGDGGQGGRGGIITVLAHGLPIEPFLQFDVRGGRPGNPGNGGPGGPGGFFRSQRNTNYNIVGRQGPPGPPGRPGLEGPPGQVLVQP